MTTAVQAMVICAENNRAFPEIFRRQYFLTERDGQCPDGWQVKRLGHWRLYHCPDLPIKEIRDSAGKRAGYFLGIGVDREGRNFRDHATLPAAMGEAGFWAAAESVVEGIAGRYTVLLAAGGRARAYLDPVCDLSMVFDPVERVVASSLLLCLHRPLVWNRRMNHRGVLRGKHNFALQHTSDRFVKRAMANHYLDLSSFCMVRHFPKGDEVYEGGDDALTAACERIIARLRQTMTVLLRDYSCALPVTGGNDSRNLLACCTREQLQGARLYTHHVNKMSGFDCIIGQKIGALVGAEVEIVDAKAKASKPLYEEQAMSRVRWARMISSGYQTAGKDPRTIVAEQLAPQADLLLRGNVMELMRANQYPAGNLKFSVAHGLTKLRAAAEIDDTQVAVWGPDYMMWADTLPANAAHRLYDFAFVEQLLPNTMGGTLTSLQPQFYMNPFADRGLITLAQSMAPWLRKENRMNRALVDLAWPELNSVERTEEFKQVEGNHQQYDKEFRTA